MVFHELVMNMLKYPEETKDYFERVMKEDAMFFEYICEQEICPAFAPIICGTSALRERKAAQKYLKYSKFDTIKRLDQDLIIFYYAPYYDKNPLAQREIQLETDKIKQKYDEQIKSLQQKLEQKRIEYNKIDSDLMDLQTAFGQLKKQLIDKNEQFKNLSQLAGQKVGCHIVNAIEQIQNLCFEMDQTPDKIIIQSARQLLLEAVDQLIKGFSPMIVQSVGGDSKIQIGLKPIIEDVRFIQNKTPIAYDMEQHAIADRTNSPLEVIAVTSGLRNTQTGEIIAKAQVVSVPIKKKPPQPNQNKPKPKKQHSKSSICTSNIKPIKITEVPHD